nr:uncharacterized protein CI109_002290 [Kwoniella shandongensis]KAA5529397.1 hypothetical protein CI109_002290 [Kwoniella shandongensis]
MISARRESGLEGDGHENGWDQETIAAASGSSSIPANGSRSEDQSQTGISTPPSNSSHIHSENDGFLGVVAKWGGEDETRSSGSARTSRMIGSKIGLSPPPPPGPPPSDPPPLPPAPSSHPFASSRPRPSARLSSLSSLRKANLTSTSRPGSPAGPPPTSDLPPLPGQVNGQNAAGPSSNKRPSGHRRKSSRGDESIRTTSPPLSPTPPQVSPRSSSLFSSATPPGYSGAGPSTLPSLGTPIALSSITQTSAPVPIQPAHVAGHATSSRPSRTPSRHLLQTALDLAQKAVEMDKNNDVAGALAAYREAVSRLKSVMERVGVDKDDKKRRSGSGKTEEEGRTLRGIHDAYVARIHLLSSYESNPGTEPASSSYTPDSATTLASSSSATSSQPLYPSASTSTLVPPANDVEPTPRSSFDDGGMTGIGNLMLSDPGDQSFDSSAMSPPRASATNNGPTSTSTPPPSMGSRLMSQTSVGNTLSTSSPKLPAINGTSRDDMSLQQALDQAAEASSSSPALKKGSAGRGIGLGFPSSSPASASTPNYTPAHGRTFSGGAESFTSSSSPSKTRLKRIRPSLGLDMEADLTGIDGVSDDVEMLAKTPRDERTLHGVPVHRPRSDSVPSINPQLSSPDSVHTDERPLPPLPNSAPLIDASGLPIITARTASLSGASKPIRPTSGQYLVSPTTAQGTISQRRQSRPVSGSSTILLDQSQTSIQQPFPAMSSSSSTRSISASSISTRSRAKSQPGQRPDEADLPPVPVNQARHQPSFSVSSQRSVQLQSGSKGVPAGLRIHTGPTTGLAPPAMITSHSGSPRYLPPLPDSATSGLISPLPETQPTEVARRPFHLLRVIHASMDPEGSGSYLTGAIHISSAVWNPSNWSSGVGGKTPAPKIHAQEVKVRCIEALILHFETLRSTGHALLDGPKEYRRGGSSAKVDSKRVGEFCAALDELDEEMDSTYKALSKGGVAVGSWKGKKVGGSSKSWGSRISRGMDKISSSKSLDSSDKYVDLLAHLCVAAQVIDEHLSNLTGSCTPSYAALPEKSYREIEGRVHRSAEFVGAVVIPFVLDDFKQFFLRYLKGGVRYLED